MRMIQVFSGLMLAALAVGTLASCKDDEQVAEPAESKKPVPVAAQKSPDPAPEPTPEPGKVPPAAPAPGDPAVKAPGKIQEAADKGSPSRNPPAPVPRPAPDKPPAAVPSPVATPAPTAQATRSLVPDLRLLLTATDVTQTAGTKAVFRRKAMPGMVVTAEQDALYYEPEKGASYGFGIQVFREKNASKAKQRFESMFASYPNSVEISPVSGNTFFAYWDEVLFVAFQTQYKGTIAVVSCGRPYCDSDDLYGLAQKVSSRLK